MLVLGLVLGVQLACGGGTEPVADTKPRIETRWLRGISATEVKTAAQSRGLTCQGPKFESGGSMWTCSSATPLVTYRVQFYGKAPLKLEYISATITQAGTAKAEFVTPLFVSLAGLHYEGGDAAQARAWVSKAIETPGETSFGPGKFRVSGDLSRMTLDIKASGSDW